MKANELMIGDLVMQDDNLQQNRACQITGIYDNVVVDVTSEKVPLHESHIKPIPLTAEILEKNGFKIEEEYDEIYDTRDYYATLTCIDSEKRNVEVNYRTFGNEITIFCNDRQNILLCRSLETQIKYVHELQHAMRLCGIGKEIEL